jgi:GNAT superfamily N-acetyltransferase
MQLEEYSSRFLSELLALSVRAWTPVFESLQRTMDPAVFQHLYPDWRESQRNTVAAACADADTHIWVAVEGAAAVGFIALKRNASAGLGEIYLLAVDPAHQRQGIGTAMLKFAASWLKQSGMSVAMVDTGGDPGHAPARKAYERQGFQPLSITRYFLRL